MMLNKHHAFIMEISMHPIRRSCAPCAAAAILMATAGCDTIRPSEVCAAEETLSVVSLQLQDIFLPGTDPGIRQEAFQSTLKINAISYDGVDRETNKISCSANLDSGSGTPVRFQYVRVPEIGTSDYLYSARVDDSRGAMGVVIALGRRYREIEQGYLVTEDGGNENSTQAPAISEETAQQQAKVGDLEGFPLGHKSAEAVLTKLEHVDTAAALMTGEMTRASARPFCSNTSTEEEVVESCITEQIETTPNPLVASANCVTKELLTSGGLPFRREVGGWRNGNTNEFFADGAPPASGILTIQSQFAVLCPQASRSMK